MLKQLIEQIVDRCMLELKKDKNQTLLKTHVIDTTLVYIVDRLSPYLLIGSIIFGLLILLMVCIVILLLRM